MTEVIIFSIVTVSAIAVLAAIILFFVAKKFYVYEDPRIDEVEDALPAANCGGCGFPGCRNFAEECVKSDNFGSLYCPVGGNECMADVAKILGKEAVAKDPLVAVIRCHGTPEFRKRTTKYDGTTTCAIESSLYSGHTDCQFGCLGHGDCVVVCDFEAIFMGDETKLPYVIDDMCTACGACVEACPKNIIELRKKNKKDRKIFVSCVNEDKGGAAKKACDVACIGCKKCFKVCPFEAITVENFLAQIHHDKCKLCRKCVLECPTNAIHEINFPERKVRPAKKAIAPKKKPVTKKDLSTTEKEKPVTKKDLTVTEKIKTEAPKDIDLKKIAKENNEKKEKK